MKCKCGYSSDKVGMFVHLQLTKPPRWNKDLVERGIVSQERYLKSLEAMRKWEHEHKVEVAQ